MGKQSADRFLTCVLKRPDNDLVIRIGAILMIMLIVPMIALLLTIDSVWVYNTYIVDSSKTVDLLTFFFNHMDDIAGAHLFEYCIGVFLMYMIMNTFMGHLRRDIVWMDSLIEYAEDYGHETDRLKEMREDMMVGHSERYTKFFLVWFVVVAVVCVLQCVFISMKDMEPHAAVMVVNILIFEVIVQMSFTTVYLYKYVQNCDMRQCEFTEEFVRLMKDDIPDACPMKTNMKYGSVRTVMFATILTLGMLSVFGIMYAIHRLNIHICTQWSYEEDLLKTIGLKEGANSIIRIPKERKGIAKLAENFFNAIGNIFE